jgi:REP element-mobilizing transposase RayT
MRRPRIHIPNACYHVILRGNHQQAIFFLDTDRTLFERYVGDACGRSGARIHAYCWMTNHVHLLVQVADKPLGIFMQHVGTRYARAAQVRVDTTGHLFQNRYQALLVDVDAYFLELLRYIHLNPVRGGLVADPADYPWSSHRAYLGMPGASDEAAKWLATDFGLRLLGAGDPDRARSKLRRFVAAGLRAPRNPLYSEGPAKGPRVLGSAAFVQSVMKDGVRFPRT